MNPIIRNILTVIAGWIGGSIVNMGLIQTGHFLLPIKGLDPSDMDALAKAMPAMSAEHFTFPFLAHAMGTLVGAFLAGWIAAGHKMKFSLAIGVLFLIGGIAASFMIPAPTWFVVIDLLIAYIPMAWLGGEIALRVSAYTATPFS